MDTVSLARAESVRLGQEVCGSLDGLERKKLAMPDGKVCPEQFRGWLLKWTNYIKGYQRRWFVLANGLLSYYRYLQFCTPVGTHM